MTAEMYPQRFDYDFEDEFAELISNRSVTQGEERTWRRGISRKQERLKEFDVRSSK